MGSLERLREDMLIEAVERRFGAVDAMSMERELEFFTGNGSGYIAPETRRIAWSPSIRLCVVRRVNAWPRASSTPSRDYASHTDLTVLA